MIPYWDRPKKTGGKAACGGFPLEPGDDVWALEFIAWVKEVEWTTWSYWKTVTDIALAANIGRPVAPLTLRHTFAYLFLRATRDPWRLCQVMNITLEMALNYLRLVPAQSDTVFIRGLLRKPSQAVLPCVFCGRPTDDNDSKSGRIHVGCDDKLVRQRAVIAARRVDGVLA